MFQNVKENHLGRRKTLSFIVKSGTFLKNGTFSGECLLSIHIYNIYPLKDVIYMHLVVQGFLCVYVYHYIYIYISSFLFWFETSPRTCFKNVVVLSAFCLLVGWLRQGVGGQT